MRLFNQKIKELELLNEGNNKKIVILLIKRIILLIFINTIISQILINSKFHN